MSVYLSDEDHQSIMANAGRAGLSFSAFAKMLCLGEQVRSLDTQLSIRELARINGDLGRLGGLLKLWLSNKDGHTIDVRGLLRELEARQKEIKQAVKMLEHI
ncbi:MAG: conjugal transfer protein TraJ [Desulfarculales bacterium]|nr:conjugal transfer protein TraJ [Desulfarculales bacterium]